MDCENVGKLWGPNQHFPHILPTFCQLTSHLHKSSTNYQLLVNISPTHPLNQQSIFSLPTQKSIFCLRSHILSMHRFLVWGDYGDYVDVGENADAHLVLILLKTTFPLWGECGKMLTWAKHGVNVEAGLFLTTHESWSEKSARMAYSIFFSPPGT